MTAVSKAQQAFFGLVDKVQKGELPANKVTANIQQAAKNNSKSDVKDYLNTPSHDLPDRTPMPMDDKERQKRMRDTDKKEARYIEGGDPPAKAVSGAQANFFRLVDKVQKKEIPASKVTSNVRQAAKNTARADVRKKVATDPGDGGGDTSQKRGGKKGGDVGGPEAPPPSRGRSSGKGRASKGDIMDNADMHGERDIVREIETNPMKFHEIVAKYNEYGDLLKRDRKLTELAQQLADIAEYAEYTLTSEADDWFDAHTVKRNIKEMKKYAQDFSKSAREVDLQHERLVAYYEDMGRILERYFEIADLEEEGPTVRVRKPTMTGPHFENYNPAYIKKAIRLAEHKIPKHQLAKFRSLPTNVKAGVAWRLL